MPQLSHLYIATTNLARAENIQITLREAGCDVDICVAPDLTLPIEPSDALGIVSGYGVDVLQFLFNMKHSNELSRHIVAQKVNTAYSYLNTPCIAVDSGFYIDALGGFPGTCVKLSLQLLGQQSVALSHILSRLAGKNRIQRGCEFRHCLAYRDKHHPEPKYFESASRGTLATRAKEKPKGKKMQQLYKSPFWQVFCPKGSSKTISQMTLEQYKSYSRRAHGYITDLANWLLSYNYIP